MSECKSHKQQQHKHLSDEQAQKLFAEVFTAHVKLIRGVQEKLHQDNVCESEFINMLISVVVRAASQTIEHLTVASNMPRQEAINMILGGIAEEVGASFVAINEGELMSKLRKRMNATTH